MTSKLVKKVPMETECYNSFHSLGSHANLVHDELLRAKKCYPQSFKTLLKMSCIGEISVQGEGALSLVQLSINSKLSYWKGDP